MITFLDCNLDIVHRSSPQWVYDYLEPSLLVLPSLILFCLFIALCVFIYKEIWDD